MTRVRKTGDRTQYKVVNPQCLGATCFQPGLYQIRGTTPSGSRNTGQSDPCCLCNAYRGCPDDPGYTKERERERKRDGWKVVSG